MKKRLDMLMMERALAPSREKAKAFIMAGDVYVDGQKEDKAGTMFPETVKIEVRGNTLPYVSRGGLKLEKAMKNFDVTLDSKVCMDVGASTGGFTDCMLQNGAVKVYSIDVGYGQLDWKLRNDPRAKWSTEGICHRCGNQSAGLEAPERSESGLYGENQYPLCGTGGFGRTGRFFIN